IVDRACLTAVCIGGLNRDNGRGGGIPISMPMPRCVPGGMRRRMAVEVRDEWDNPDHGADIRSEVPGSLPRRAGEAVVLQGRRETVRTDCDRPRSSTAVDTQE